ncbi:hypothetical protein GGI21_001138 [Coemansia aciculifera]|uniref:Uncharacterized protein n=1 Tax=Coemansia aciculifera TaxID=417176 RepID=A0ACC1M7H2_9FUNG|nr:hypothetical protein IWW38_001658 [Coemansia aciculifera]KAJ2910171.1 hypothetical protein GGI21_001138 [Coemansia aciculifera]
MNGQFYSPADQLSAEKARLSYTGLVASFGEPSTPDAGNGCKKRRLFYEGEPDTSKWAVPPPPDIFSAKDSIPLGLADSESVVSEAAQVPATTATGDNTVTATATHADNAPDALQCTDQGVSQSANIKSRDDVPSQPIQPRLSNETMHQIRLLCSAQNDFERRLFEHRSGMQHEQEKVLRMIHAREIVCPMPKKELDEILRQHKADLDRADRRAIEKLDELRYQQQLKLESLGVPGFYPSSSIEVMQNQQRELWRLLGK